MVLCVKGGSGSSNVLNTSKTEEYAFNVIEASDNADVVVLGKYEKGSANSYDGVARDMNT